MKIVVLGASGMLGNAVGRRMVKVFGEDNVWLTFRAQPSELCYGKHQIEFSLPLHEYTLFKIPNDADYVINCIGIIKPFVESVGSALTIYINSVFPHALEEYCQQRGIKLIHATTDCVFSGKKGNYVETDFHDCEDTYGKTKSLGEPIKHAMTLRTSIIGEETHNNASLVEWVKSQKGQTISGYNNHLWNGVTTKQYAKICCEIINDNRYEPGLFHIFSSRTVTKEQLLQYIDDRFNLGLTINSVEAPTAIDRSLSSIYDLELMLDIDCIGNQIMEM